MSKLIRSCCENGSVLDEVLSTLPSEEEVHDTALIFHALSEPTRLKIVCALLDYEMCVGEIANMLDISPSNTSHQLKVLRLARLVTYKKEGQMYFYRLKDSRLRAVINYAIKEKEIQE